MVSLRTIILCVLVAVSTLCANHYEQRVLDEIIRRNGDSEDHSSATITATNKTSNGDRVAIVITTRCVDDCLAERLDHLAQTTGPVDAMGRPRDVWVLHNHKSRLSTSRLERSKQLLQRLQDRWGVQSLQQNEQILLHFDTKRSGTAKSSFLYLVTKYQYQFAWHLEDDTFYTGPWKEILDEPTLMDSDDVVTYYTPSPKNWKWYNTTRGEDNKCFVSTTTPPPHHTKQYCEDVQRTYVRWSAIRVSLPFAQGLLLDLLTGLVSGHHEAVVAPYAKVKQFHLKQIPKQRRGQMVAGGSWKPKLEQTLNNHNPKPNLLYHPVKCVAHNTINLLTNNTSHDSNLLQQYLISKGTTNTDSTTGKMSLQ